MKTTSFLVLCFFLLSVSISHATNNHEYGTDEYITVIHGISPDTKYAITTHGEGEYGYDNFHVYLTNALTGKTIGPLEEISGTLDTGGTSFAARWSEDCKQVTIVYRISRHEPLKAMSYRIGKQRAFPLKGPSDATEEEAGWWQNSCSVSQPSPKIFGKSQAK